MENCVEFFMKLRRTHVLVGIVVVSVVLDLVIRLLSLLLPTTADEEGDENEEQQRCGGGGSCDDSGLIRRIVAFTARRAF